jgi:hypothetical protein
MTPKEKAEELVSKFNFEHTGDSYTIFQNVDESKRCALIAVDELIESHLLLTTTHDSEPSIRCKRYWQEVKQEIEDL